MQVVFYEPSFKSAGAGTSNVSEVKQAGQKAGLPEQGSPSGALAENESVWTLEARSGYTRELQRCCSQL